MNDGHAHVRHLATALESCAAEFGTFHPRTVAIANQLSIAFWRAGNIDQAISILDQALTGLDLSEDPEHPVRADVLGTLAAILAEQGHRDAASDVYREVLERSSVLNRKPI